MPAWYEYYTKINLLMLGMSKLLPSEYVDMFLWHNSLAIWTSFHAAFALIPRAYSQYLKERNLTHFQYWLHNIIGHYVPLIYLAKRRAYMHRYWSLQAAVCSLCTHCAWSWIVHGGWAMNSAYVSLLDSEWRQLWCVAIMTHMLSGYLCSRS